jgi:2-polyprenyl-6-methoxyphenol hydroxylase-like FAD-dependent oxidoreductase
MTSRVDHAVVVGGSLSGLLIGNLLRGRGVEVTIVERAAGALEGRGAGITILPGLMEGLQAAGVDETEESLGIELPGRVALGAAGEIVAELDLAQWMTSWSRLYESLRAVFPSERYREAATVERIGQDARSVTAVLAGGERISADLLIGADGIRSTVRRLVLPDVEPVYGGYIAWRCLTDERELSTGPRALRFDRYSMCIAPGVQAVGYPVPGPDGSREPGRRQYNVVWYHPVAADDLPRLLTDDAGRVHEGGIPPSLVRRFVRDEMDAHARANLAPQFAEAVTRARLVFFQPIVDLEAPRLLFGRIVLIGDAGSVARPHTAMGVPKAAGDALGLVAALQRPGALPENLAGFERARLRTHRAIVGHGRELGAYLESLIELQDDRAARERHRDPLSVLTETAAPIDYRLLERDP